MRFLPIILLSGSISLLFAQNQAANTSAPSAQPVAKKQVVAPAEKIMEGMLVSLDKTKQVLVVNLKGKEYTFQATNTTVISAGNGNKGFENLSAGTGVRVSYTKDSKGTRIAGSISQTRSSKPTSAAARQAPVAAQPAPAAARQAPVAAQPAPAAAKPAPVAAQPVTPAPRPAPAAQPAPAAVNQAANNATTAVNNAAVAAQPAAAAVNQAAGQAATTVNNAAKAIDKATAQPAPAAKPVPAPAPAK